MDDDHDPNAPLPTSVGENIGTISEFYARHEQRVSTTQRIVEKVALFLGSPSYVAANILFIVFWTVGNLMAPDMGWDQVDEPPFFWLQGFVSLNAFIISTTVLIRQNRMSVLADHHAHLDLQVNLLTEEKTSKIIEMLEALRRDLPGVRQQEDPEAEELAKPADPEQVLDAIEREHDEPYGEAGNRSRERQADTD
ncbi:DUF1003 domain-containing protein [Massilia sp. YIM B02763]|uniref:DUF1003 domain-containing protein n=1 Tax=Massilia sp. YIM B02763 TaxID=3050130 RepID=UPI0025B6CE6D|nr:DUF1003 domain-containing protein [Massilia sp. YIM B02763]MDN4055459.1 DUF1003 domain-containing protein [Massilia sp. YIM B02763]